GGKLAFEQIQNHLSVRRVGCSARRYDLQEDHSISSSQITGRARQRNEYSRRSLGPGPKGQSSGSTIAALDHFWGVAGHPGRGLTPATALPAWHLCNMQQKSSMTRSMFIDSAFSRVAMQALRARCDMKKILAAAAITLAFAPSGVLAQERV